MAIMKISKDHTSVSNFFNFNLKSSDSTSLPGKRAGKKSVVTVFLENSNFLKLSQKLK